MSNFQPIFSSESRPFDVVEQIMLNEYPFIDINETTPSTEEELQNIRFNATLHNINNVESTVRNIFGFAQHKESSLACQFALNNFKEDHLAALSELSTGELYLNVYDEILFDSSTRNEYLVNSLAVLGESSTRRILVPKAVAEAERIKSLSGDEINNKTNEIKRLIKEGLHPVYIAIVACYIGVPETTLIGYREEFKNVTGLIGSNREYLDVLRKIFGRLRPYNIKQYRDIIAKTYNVFLPTNNSGIRSFNRDPVTYFNFMNYLVDNEIISPFYIDTREFGRTEIEKIVRPVAVLSGFSRELQIELLKNGHSQGEEQDRFFNTKYSDQYTSKLLTAYHIYS